ncbi:MAG: hypothetical protein OHK0057_32850 [Thermoflexibacter sp.]
MKKILIFIALFLSMYALSALMGDSLFEVRLIIKSAIFALLMTLILPTLKKITVNLTQKMTNGLNHK